MRTDWPEQRVEWPPAAGRRSFEPGILAEITAGLAAGTDLNGLLERFLAPIMQIAGARAGAVRVLSPEGDRLQMISEVGLPDHVALAERAVDRACGVCGAAFARDTIVSASELGHCALHSHDTYFGHECLHLMAVPLTYRGRVLGVYNLFFDSRPAADGESGALFKSIGELLGLAVHNAMLERETLRATVLAERQAMAAEVHDSIAQTLAFVKMRLPLLQEAIAGHDDASAMRYCSDVRQAVSSAHSNLREVLAHFRAPMDPLGLRNALQGCIAGFRELTQIDLSFDEQLPDLHLSVAQEFQVFRIVQEALANIAKHAAGATGMADDPSAGRPRRRGDRRRRHRCARSGRGRRRRTLRTGDHAPTGRQPRRRTRGGATRWRRHAGAAAVSDRGQASGRARGNMNAEPLRVVLVDDHALCRSGLSDLLQHRGIEVVAALGDPGKLAAVLQEHKPDLLVLDLRMPSTDGLTLLRRLRSEGCDTPALVLTMSDSEADLAAALRAGVIGYVLKDMEPEEVVGAIERAARGELVVAPAMTLKLAQMLRSGGEGGTDRKGLIHSLTDRERQILDRLARGESNKAIARALDISHDTVKLHVRHILSKLNLTSRVEAAVFAVESRVAEEGRINR